MSNLDKLITAGLISATHNLPDNDTDALEKLSDHEVNALISAKQKLGDDFLKRHVTCDGADCFI